MTVAAQFALLKQTAGVLTFQNTGDTPFPMVLIRRVHLKSGPMLIF